MFDPAGLGLVPFTPDRFEDTLRALHLLLRRGEGFTAFRQIGNVAHEKPADPPVAENGLQQHDHRLFVGVPTLSQHLLQETVANREEFGPGPLGVLADFPGF